MLKKFSVENFKGFKDKITLEYEGYDGRQIKQADVNLLAYPLGYLARYYRHNDHADEECRREEPYPHSCIVNVQVVANNTEQSLIRNKHNALYEGAYKADDIYISFIHSIHLNKQYL